MSVSGLWRLPRTALHYTRLSLPKHRSVPRGVFVCHQHSSVCTAAAVRAQPTAPSVDRVVVDLDAQKGAASWHRVKRWVVFADLHVRLLPSCYLLTLPYLAFYSSL